MPCRAMGRNLRITGSCGQLGVAEQHLDDPDIGIGLQQMGREAVAESVQRCRLLDARHVFGRGERSVQLSRR